MGRAAELRQLLDLHRSRKGAAYMLTLTLPHDEGDDLEPLRRHVARSWQSFQGGAPWKRWKARIGFVGSVRALEVTHGVNGWHPHLHVLILVRVELPPQLLREFEQWAWERWARFVSKKNKDNGRHYRVPSREHGAVITSSNRDDYIAKLGLADEVAKASWKAAREGRRTPLQILRDIAVNAGHKVRDLALWAEYAREMFGARQLTWSKGLRERYALPEQTDLELVLREEKQPAVEYFKFSVADWDNLIALNLPLQMRLLAAVEDHPPGEGLEAIVRLLDKAKGLAPVPF